MELKTADRGLLREKILEAEWRMFRQVKPSTPVACQNRPETFKAVRGSIFELWPKELLSAYLRQLQEAVKGGRNLLTEKYARMDRLIPPLSSSPFLKEIVAIEARWQDEIHRIYPALYSRTCRSTDQADNGSNFSVYIHAELETYGDEAIAIYRQWVSEAESKGENISLNMLEKLVVRGGFKNLEQAESYFSREQR